MKKTLRRLALLSVAMVLGFASCEDPMIEDLVNTDLPAVITNEVSDITANGAKTGGYVSAQGGAEVVSRGVCYSTTQNPTVANSRTDDGQGMGGFTSTLTGLTPATTYYVRAYATNQHGTAYGEERSFTTLNRTTGLNVTFGTQSWSAAEYEAVYLSNYGAVVINASAIQGQDYPQIQMALYTASAGTYTDAIGSDCDLLI